MMSVRTNAGANSFGMFNQTMTVSTDATTSSHHNRSFRLNITLRTTLLEVASALNQGREFRQQEFQHVLLGQLRDRVVGDRSL